MVHTRRPLQEKMALFWHQHFATAYSKIANAVGGEGATQMMAAKRSEHPAGLWSQLELFRDYALPNFRDLLVEVAKDPAMLFWLDGRLNTKARPQENFAREVMELFTIGVGQFAESDVYAGARVFTGWNLQRIGEARDPLGFYQFFYNGAQHDTNAKTFSFPIYPDGSKTIPARAASAGMQDGVDLLAALARHPATGRRLAQKLWSFFISEIRAPDEAFVSRIAKVYTDSDCHMSPVVRAVLSSREFDARDSYFARLLVACRVRRSRAERSRPCGISAEQRARPALEHGAAALRAAGRGGMGAGPAWFTTAAMLARMNFAATLTSRQRNDIAAGAAGNGSTPEALLSFYLDRLSPAPFEQDAYASLLDYLRARYGVDRQRRAASREGARPHSPDRRLVGVSARMKFTRRDFVRGGVSAFSLGFAAPRFLCDIALAQGAAFRNLVVLYLGGGNDSLSMLVPYRDSFYQSRRPSLAVPAGQVLQIGRDSAGNELGLHPRLTGLRTIFNEGRLALIQRTGYENSSRSHFEGTDIWSTANPLSTQGPGWLGRYLDTIPAPVDPLDAWNTGAEVPHALLSRLVGVPSISNPATYAFQSPNGATEAADEREAPCACRRICRCNRPHLAFVNASAQSAFATLDRVATVGAYVPTVTYPTNGFALALRAVAGALATQIGTRVFWVQTGGYDTHAAQRRHVCHADDDAERRAARVLSGLEQSGTAERHAGAAVLGVRAAHHRKRQRRDRSRRRERDDGHRRAGEGRHLRHGAVVVAGSRQSHAREWRRTTCDTKPTSDRCTRASSTTGSAPTRPPSSAATSVAGLLNFCSWN